MRSSSLLSVIVGRKSLPVDQIGSIKQAGTILVFIELVTLAEFGS